MTDAKHRREGAINALMLFTREQLISHLSLAGWVPVESATAGIMRGVARVSIVTRSGYLSDGGKPRYSVTYYEHPDVPPGRREVPWAAIRRVYFLRMMAVKLVHEDAL